MAVGSLFVFDLPWWTALLCNFPIKGIKEGVVLCLLVGSSFTFTDLSFSVWMDVDLLGCGGSSLLFFRGKTSPFVLLPMIQGVFN